MASESTDQTLNQDAASIGFAGLNVPITWPITHE